jgi:hypothetical protein
VVCHKNNKNNFSLFKKNMQTGVSESAGPGNVELGAVAEPRGRKPLGGNDEDEDNQMPKGFFESDLFQQLVMTVNTLVAIFSACMAALLSLFVPQLCCPDVSIANFPYHLFFWFVSVLLRARQPFPVIERCQTTGDLFGVHKRPTILCKFNNWSRNKWAGLLGV